MILYSIIFTVVVLFFVSYYLKKEKINNKILISIDKRGNFYRFNKEKVEKNGLRYNTIKFCTVYRSVSIVPYQTEYTVRRTNKGFLIFTTWSKNRKQSHKIHEIFVCDDVLVKLVDNEIYSGLLKGLEYACVLTERIVK